MGTSTEDKKDKLEVRVEGVVEEVPMWGINGGNGKDNSEVQVQVQVVVLG